MPTSMDKTAACTTFVQTDAATFKDLVQRLTGTARDNPPPPSPPLPLSSSSSRPPHDPATAAANSAKLAGAKRLHERRRGFSRRKLAIDKPINAGSALLSPALSPLVSPSTPFAGLRISEEVMNREEEERAIKERRFFLHPSPRGRTRSAAAPELLPLFPMSSPRSETRSPP